MLYLDYPYDHFTIGHHFKHSQTHKLQSRLKYAAKYREIFFLGNHSCETFVIDAHRHITSMIYYGNVIVGNQNFRLVLLNSI